MTPEASTPQPLPILQTTVSIPRTNGLTGAQIIFKIDGLREILESHFTGVKVQFHEGSTRSSGWIVEASAESSPDDLGPTSFRTVLETWRDAVLHGNPEATSRPGFGQGRPADASVDGPYSGRLGVSTELDGPSHTSRPAGWQGPAR